MAISTATLNKRDGKNDAHASVFASLLATVIGEPRAAALIERVDVADALIDGAAGERGVSRGAVAQLLAMTLLDDLLERVPLARRYVDALDPAQRTLMLDHGAVRTVDAADTGELPRGRAAFSRLLEPLGYVQAATYPLHALRMTGYAFRHRDLPEDVCQFFVSELHADALGPAASATAQRIMGTAVDPLTANARTRLAEIDADAVLAPDRAVELVLALRACFARCHALPSVADYEHVLAASPEMAWIATEGNAFNHAADRVPDITAVEAHERALGRPLKPTIEVSQSGRVRQTAYRAEAVRRDLRNADGTACARNVPGSFFEFISRAVIPGSGQLDLAFDAANAQGIFGMTVV